MKSQHHAQYQQGRSGAAVTDVRYVLTKYLVKFTGVKREDATSVSLLETIKLKLASEDVVQMPQSHYVKKQGHSLVD